MDYARYRETAMRLIAKYGTVGTITTVRQVSPDPTKPWNAVPTSVELPIKLVTFPDDGVTFVDHNVTGNVRIAIVAPSTELRNVAVGDVVRYGLETAAVKKYKAIDPDGSGVIVWSLLIA